MKLRTFLFSLITLTAILFSNTSNGQAKPLSSGSQQSGQVPILCITSAPDLSAFPNIGINFRMIDGNLSPIVPTDTDLRFSENNQAPVPLASAIQRNATVGGINYYIIVDKGNRTLQGSVRSILQTITSYVDETVDKVQIYTDEKNDTQLYYPGTGFNSFTQAVSAFPIENDSRPRQVMKSFYKALEAVEGNTDACQNMRVIIFIMGDEAILKDEILTAAQRAKASFTRLAILHLSGTTSGNYQSRGIYTDLANRASGIYRQVISLDNDVRPVLDELALYKQTFSTTYRTNYGGSDAHNIGATYQNTNIIVAGQSTYQITILPPTVSISGETVINRLSQTVNDKGENIYPTNDLPYVIKIDWGDSYPREIKDASIIVKEGDTESEIPVSLVSKGDNSYEASWNFSKINTPGEHPLIVSIKLTDEFGVQATSPTINVTLKNNVEGPPAVMWALYILGAVVVALIVLTIFMWRKMLSFAKQGGAVIGKIADDIRKTIVGGGKRSKPLATLKVLDGPPNMIDQELKVFTESVKLGRNPQLADMTFYGPSIQTSVSGLHARLEKMNGGWRIVALSQSGSETFIDDQPIPFNEPVKIKGGQKIRLGYIASQPVVLEFQTEYSEVRVTSVDHGDEVRKTDVKMDPDETVVEQQGFFSPNKKRTQSKKQSQENSDSVFDEFR